MNNHRKSLAKELMLLIVAGICIGMLLFFGLRDIMYTVLDKELLNWHSVVDQENKTVASLQSFIDENDLSIGEIDRLEEWAKKNQDVYITLYYDGEAVFSSESQLEVQILSETNNTLENTDPSFTLHFKDENVQMTTFVTYKSYYRIADMASGILSFFVFLGIILYYIRKKLNYIMEIESDLKILGGGDLTYSIKIKGNDELASLAEEVERMRCALLERQETEKAALDANKGLVTAMSHDLRTPLTALIGYLELLKIDSDYSEHQLHYLKLAGEKAVHIKDLSDQLFSYFLVFQKDLESLELTTVNGAEFWMQYIEEMIHDLKDRGYQVECETKPLKGSLEIDLALMKRVFDNLYSNILKYADLKRPIRIGTKIKEEKLLIQFENGICEKKEYKESTEIGLKTCEKIIKMHQGQIEYIRGESFVVKIELPYYK